MDDEARREAAGVVGTYTYVLYQGGRGGGLSTVNHSTETTGRSAPSATLNTLILFQAKGLDY